MSSDISFEAFFDNAEEQPDEYHSESGLAPVDKFIVAYDRDGQPISRYGDDIWDFSAYQKNKPALKFNFVSWNKSGTSDEIINIKNEMKWILFLYWYFSDSSKSPNTLNTKLSVLRNIAKYCANQSISIIELLNDPICLATYLSGMKSKVKDISGLITLLINIGETKRGFPLNLGDNLNRISKNIRIELDNEKQHPVIPTRIYSALIVRAIEEIESFETIADSYLAMMRDCAIDRKLGRSQPIRKRNNRKGTSKQKKRPLNFHEMLDHYGTTDYIKEYSLKYDVDIKSIKCLSAHLKQRQCTCYLLISIFSGMRRGEINRLPYDCIETAYENGRKHYRIRGETFKLANGQSDRTSWVTDQLAERAISLAQKIATMIYSTIDLSLNSEQKLDSDYPLFIGVGYLSSRSKKGRVRGEAPYSNSKGLGTKEIIPDNFFLEITEEDMLELEAIDPFRNWRSENKFAIGARWLYSPHQARRSLAVYAAASGLVSLSSLKRQLQHITEEMTIYYAKGSAFAKNFVAGKKDHFYRDYQAAQPEAQALLYIAQVLMSNEPLFGGHGAWISQRLSPGETITVGTRQDTMQKCKNGEFAYKPTPVGGCTEVDICNKKAMRTITACLECAKAVIKSSSVDKVIKITQTQIGRLDPTSKESELKVIDLSSLMAYSARIKKKNGNKQ